MDKTSTKRLRTSILDQTKNSLRIRQSTFRNGISHLYTHRCQNKSSRDKLEFCIPIKQDNCKHDPTYILEQRIRMSVLNSNSSVDTFRKKEGSCQTRKNLVDMMNWLHNCLQSLQNMNQEETSSQQSTFEYLQKVYSACMLELIQTTRKECVQRAQILQLVWNNLMDLSKWLQQYFKKKFANYTNQLICKSDQQTRRHLFVIDQLQNQVKRLKEEISKREKYFYEVVKDNRLLRQRNNKLLLKLKFQEEGNVALKEQNLVFYKENEKMRMILSQQIDVKSIELLNKRIKDIQRSLLTRKHITKKNLMNEIREKEITSKFQEEIKVIIKRINEEDVLDLEYQEQVQMHIQRQVFQNIMVQTQKLKTEEKSVNTCQFISPKTTTADNQTQTQLNCNQIIKVCSMKIQQLKFEEENNSKITLQSSRQRRISPVTDSSLKRRSSVMNTSLRGEYDLSMFLKRLEQVPRDYEEKVNKLNNIYYIITKIIDALRMNITGMASFQQVRVKQDTRLSSGRALNQMKKLFISEGMSIVDKFNQTKAGVFPRHNKSSDWLDKRRSKQISVKNAEQFRSIFQMVDKQNEQSSEYKFFNNLQHKRGGANPKAIYDRVIYDRARKQSVRTDYQQKPTNSYVRKSIFKTLSDSQNHSNQATCKNLEGISGYVQPYHVAKLMSMRQKKLKEENSPSISLSVSPTRRSMQQPKQVERAMQSPVLQAEFQSEESESCNSSMSCSGYSDEIVQSVVQQNIEKRQQTEVCQRTSEGQLFNSTLNLQEQTIEVTPIKSLISEQKQQKKKSTSNKINQAGRFSIVSNNFRSKQDIINYFNKAAGKEPTNTLTTTQIQINKRCQFNSHLDKDLAEQLHNTIEDNSFTVDSNCSVHKVALPTINTIIENLEKAMIYKLKAQQQVKGQAKSTTLYGRNMLRRLYNFILKEAYRQRQFLIRKQCDFKYFLQHWILHRYGLNQICHQVTQKIKMSLQKCKNQSPEFRCMSLLLSSKTDKYMFRKGMFRIFVLFVQYGVENCQLLKQNGSCAVELSKYQQFLGQLLTVFYNDQDIIGFLNSVIHKYNSTVINPFTLFEQLYWFIQKTSANSQLSSIIKCLCQLPGYSHQQLTLQSLVNLWSVLQPNQFALENGFIKLLKFARLQLQQQGRRLSIPVYMLVLLSKKYGWTVFINPIQTLSTRYEQHFGKILPHQQLLKGWLLEHQALLKYIPRCSSLIELVDSRMVRYKVGLTKAKQQTFPAILYQIVKLNLVEEVYRRYEGQFISWDLNIIQTTANKLLRKKEAMQMFS